MELNLIMFKKLFFIIILLSITKLQSQVDTIAIKKLLLGKVKPKNVEKYNKIFENNWKVISFVTKDSIKPFDFKDSNSITDKFQFFKLDKQYIYFYKNETDSNITNTFKVFIVEKNNRLSTLKLTLLIDSFINLEMKFRIINIQNNLLLIEMLYIKIDGEKIKSNQSNRHLIICQKY